MKENITERLVRWIAKIMIIGIILIVLASTAFGAIAIVPPGHRGVLLTWGKVEPVILSEGISMITPYVNQVQIMSIQTQKYPASASAASKDLQTVSTEVTINYRIEPNAVNTVYQNLGLGFEDKVIQPAIQEAVKASTAKYTAEELITKREQVKNDIEQALMDRMQKFGGVTIQQISITNFDFSSEFNTAIEAKVTAEQKALKAQNDLVRIQIEAQQQIAMAQGQANATLTNAVAAAESIRIQAQALKENPNLVSLKWVEKWDGKLPTTMFSGGNADTSFLMPLNLGTETKTLSGGG